MKWKRVIISLFVFVIFLISLQRVIVNIFFNNKENLKIGVVYKVNSYNDVEGNSSMISFRARALNSHSDFNGEYHYRQGYYIELGDTLICRNLYNGGVRALKKNGIIIQSYYSFWDYGSVVFVLIIIVGFFYVPRMLKKMKNENSFS